MSDFTAIIEQGVPFTATELDEGVDFTPSGDLGQVVISGSGFGEGGFGEGGFGGSSSVTLSSVTTVWTNIETP